MANIICSWLSLIFLLERSISGSVDDAEFFISGTILPLNTFFLRKKSMALFLETVYSHAVGFLGNPFNPQVSAAKRKVSLAMSSAISMYSIPNNLLSTATILLYSVRNKCGISSCSFINKKAPVKVQKHFIIAGNFSPWVQWSLLPRYRLPSGWGNRWRSPPLHPVRQPSRYYNHQWLP